jgi:hypothetical protein
VVISSTGTSGGAPAGSSWVTQAQWDAFNGAYTAAVEAASNPDAAKNTVDAAKTGLENAITAFTAAIAVNGQGTGANKIAVTGLSSIYNNGTEVTVALVNSNDWNELEGAGEGSLIAEGEGTVTGGGLTVSLNSGNDPWAGSGSYYVAFSSDEVFIFISREKIAFGGGTVSKVYGDFELLAYPLTLSDVYEEDFTAMTLDDFIYAATADMPGGPYNYTAWKPAMKTLVEGMVEIHTKLSLDYTLYKDKECTQEFSGTDMVDPETVIYCKAPISTGQDGVVDPGGPNVITLSGTVRVTLNGQAIPKVKIEAYTQQTEEPWEMIFLDSTELTSPGAGASWSMTIPASDTYTFVHFSVAAYDSNGNLVFSRDYVSSTMVSNYDQPGIVLDLGNYITLSGTIDVSANGAPVPRVVISSHDVTWSSSGSTTLTSPASGASWSFAIPELSSPTNIIIDVEGHSDAAAYALIFSRYSFTTLTGVYKSAVPDIALNIGDASPITLSGTVSVTFNGQPVPRVMVSVSKPYSGGGQQAVKDTYLTYPGPNAEWSMTIPAFLEPTNITFHVGAYESEGSPPLFGWGDAVYETGVMNTDRGGITLTMGNYITLSGTVDVTYRGEPTFVFISASYTGPGGGGPDRYGSTNLSDPGPATPWAINIPAFDEPTELTFGVWRNDYIYNTYNTLFSWSTKVPFLASVTGHSGIVLNVGDIVPPPAPSGLTVTGSTSDTISLSWNSVPGVAANAYKVYRSTSAGGTYTLRNSLVDTPYTDSYIAVPGTYYYRVSALGDYDTESDQSGYVSGTTTGGGGG